jgi:type IV secretory pathway VirB6-like protein
MIKIFQENHISNKLLQLVRSILLGSFLFFTLLYSSPSYADQKDLIRECIPLAGEPNTENPYPVGLDYDITTGGKDFLFDPTNPVCMAVVLPSYIATKASIVAMRIACGTGSVGSPFPRPIQDSFAITRATAKCIATSNLACCGAVIAGAASLASFVAVAKIQHTVAQEAYENSYLCGNAGKDGVGSWAKWNSFTMTKNIDGTAKIEAEDPRTLTNDPVLAQQYREWYFGGVEKEDVSDEPCADVNVDLKSATVSVADSLRTRVSYGENEYPVQRYYMRGTEPGNYACDRFNRRLNVGKKNPNASTEDYEKAHQCCLKKSKSYVCVERKYCGAAGSWLASSAGISTCLGNNTITSHKFCKAGTSCEIGGISSGNSASPVTYAAKFRENNRMICVSTTSLCPYDFNIGGGSLECEYFKDGVFVVDKPREEVNFTPFDHNIISETGNNRCAGKSEIRNNDCTLNKYAGRCRNYCQTLNHCVIVSGSDYIYDTNISSPYFSKACMDFVGDSKNKYGYGEATMAGDTSITGVQRHFSAPIAQCFKETIENVFNGKAGHTRCGMVNEYPDKNGECSTDFYVYKQGEQVDQKSFFTRIQDNLKDMIKLVLTISIMMQGFKILLTGDVIKRKDLLMYVVKIGLVLFFATGNAWQGYFFDGVYSASATLSNVVYKSSSSLTNLTGGAFSTGENSTMDGCQFGEIKLANGSSGIINSEYPKGKEYLAVFDSIDCKIARYLGFGPQATVATAVLLIIPAMITPVAGAIGLFFAVLTMAFGILMIIVAIRTLHIFLFCSLIVVLLVYVSPMAIVAVLFEKTKNIFNTWLNLLIAYSLQPMMLFAYIGFFIAIFETLVTGSATFKGDSPQREMVCDKICVDKNGNYLRTLGTAGALGGQTSLTPGAVPCNFANGDKELDPMSDSLVCMMNMNNSNIKSNPALAPFGIGLTMLNDLLFSGDAGRQKILTMIKSVIIIYILAGFLEEIPRLAAQIIGGNPIPKAGLPNASGGRAIQLRAARAAVKAGAVLRRTVQDAAKGKTEDKKPSGGGSSGGVG